MFALKITLLFFIIKYAESQDCTTPDKKSGQCISLASCPTLVNFLNNSPKPFSDELKALLNKYVCGYENVAAETRMCCPSEPIDTNNRNGKDIPPPPPPDVSNHANRKLLPDNCGVIDLGNKIRGGTDAGLRDFPWMALLAYKTGTGDQFKCGGSIINDRYILTAAHCVVNTQYPLVSVRVGEYSLLSEKDCDDQNVCLPPPQDLSIEKKITHPKYNITSYENDIALLRVQKIDLESDGMKAVCLPIYEEVVTQKYNYGEVTGWGFTDPFGTSVVDKLQRVSLKKRNITVCEDVYKVQPEIKISYKQICVGGEGIKDSCRGDSGGPFQVASSFNEEDRYVQRGVVSIGHRFCGTEDFPGVYTNIVYYADWILDNINP